MKMAYHVLMVIAVASDIHGNNTAWNAFLRKAEAHQAEQILIAGDLGLSDLDPFVGISPLLVKGNCDSSYDFVERGRPLPPLFVRTEWNGRTIVMTHGDRFPSPYGFDMKKEDVFIFGHIHQPRLYRDGDGIIIVNPGSLSFPRGTEGSTYALLTERGIEIRSMGEGDKKLHFLSLKEK